MNTETAFRNAGIRSTYFWAADYGDIRKAFDAASRLEDAIFDSGREADVVRLTGGHTWSIGYRVDEVQLEDLSNERLVGVRVA